ncbi:MAG: HIT family protein [Gaiellaceae bacterium]
MTRPLWAPWRGEYVENADRQEGCVLCRAAELPEEESLVLHRGEHAFAVLNRFPYSSGHLMLAPHRHVGVFAELALEEAAELHALTVAALAALSAVYAPEGFNIGWNLGRVAGAGVADHVHEHVVPRWSGDTNFMPVLGDVKVLPEHLRSTRARLLQVWPG